MGSVQSLNPTRDLGRFFEFMYSDKEGYVYCATKDPENNNFEQFFYLWPQQKDVLVEHVLQESDSKEVYYGPAIFKEPKADKESVLGSYYIWCEFDGNVPESIEGIPVPSLKVQSSTEDHQHWYWRLDYFETNTDKLEDVMQRLVYKANADFCWNVNRILRPPYTLHHESARRTSILRQSTAPIRIEEFADLPEIPTKLIASEDINFIPDPLVPISKYAWPTEALKLFTDTVEHGSRSSALTKMSHFCIEMGMTNAETLSILINADKRWGKFSHRKDQRKRLIDIINYCRAKQGAKNPVDVASDFKEPRLKVFTYDEFKNTPIEIEWVIPEFIHKKGFIVLSGPPDVGKSQLSLRFAEKLAKGEKFLKWQPERPMKTIFLSLEMQHEELRLIMDHMNFTESDALRENLLLAPPGQAIKIISKEGQESLNEAMDFHKPDGIIIDSLGAALLDDITSEKVIFSLVEYVNTYIRDEFNAFVWFIHHPRKGQIGNKTPNKLDDLYGNQYIGSSATNSVSLWPHDNLIDVTCNKLRLAKKFSPFKIKRTPLLDFEIVDGQRSIENVEIKEGDFGIGI